MSARAPRSTIDGLVRPGTFRRRRGLRSAVLVLTTAPLILGAAAFAAHLIWNTDRALDGSFIERITADLGFAITRVEIHGNRYARRSDIVAALALETGTSQLAFHTAAARRRIEALPWVLQASVRRDLPDGIAVEITERRPALVWRASDRDLLVDIDGRTLTTMQSGSDLGLPVVTGDHAGPAAPDLLSLLGQHAEIQRRVVEARRIEGRRWTLLMTSGALVHLPSDGVAATLAWLESQAGNGLLDLALVAIDLRVAGQLVVRGSDVRRRETARSTGQSTRSSLAGGGAP